MSILAWIVLGGLAGWIASLIMKTDSSQGILLNIVVGIVGAALGGWIFGLFGGSGRNRLQLVQLLSLNSRIGSSTSARAYGYQSVVTM